MNENNLNSISWNELTGKDVKTNDVEKLGEIKSLGPDFIEIESGHVSKSRYYIPKYYSKFYDGDDLYIDLSKKEVKEKFEREQPPLPNELETQEYIDRKTKMDKEFPQFVDGVPFMAKEPDIVLTLDPNKNEQLKIPWNEVVNKHVRSSDNVDIGDIEQVGNGYIVVREGVAKIRKYYIPTSFIENYDGSSFFVKSPSGLISPRFERTTEPSPEELRLLQEEKPKEVPKV
ncbi:MAG: hypothetical protein MRJ93_03370 [Nitrososphaeraceae archaeon]|nr:hypothetical protein [Nitrososphaeraceae archaeon]